MIHPRQLSQEIRLTRERFHGLCETLWDQYAASHGYFEERMPLLPSIPETPEDWPEASMMVVRREASLRNVLIFNLTGHLGFPECNGLIGPDEGRIFVDGFHSVDGNWVSWATEVVESFTTRIAGLEFRVTTESRPTWTTGGDPYDLSEIQAALYPSRQIAIEFRLHAILESEDLPELERRRDAVFAELHAALGDPLMAIGNKRIWSTTAQGLVMAHARMSERRGEYTFSFEIVSYKAGGDKATKASLLADMMSRKLLYDQYGEDY